MAASNATDVSFILNTDKIVTNNSSIAGALPTGRYEKSTWGINQRIPSSGEVMPAPDGDYTVPDNGYLEDRFMSSSPFELGNDYLEV